MLKPGQCLRLCLCLWSFFGVAQEPVRTVPAPSSDPKVDPTLRVSFDAWRDKLAEAMFGIRPSAFGDVLVAPNDEGKKKLDWGAFELDLEGKLHENLDAALAVVATRDATQLPVAFLDFHPFGGGIAPRGRLWVEKGFHIQVGRFDVPFGNDWQFFASKDSASISRPLTTDGIMDGGYNDLGLRVLGNNGAVNFNTFILRGFGEGRLVGGRFGLTPFGNPFSLRKTREPKIAEFGISLLYDTDRSRKRELAWAADAEGRLGPYQIRAEYLWRRREPGDSEEGSTKQGWHLTQEFAFADLPLPTTIFLRYDRITERSSLLPPEDDRDTRLTAGASAGLAGFLQLKVEWQHRLQARTASRETPGYSRNLWLAQLVVVF